MNTSCGCECGGVPGIMHCFSYFVAQTVCILMLWRTEPKNWNTSQLIVLSRCERNGLMSLCYTQKCFARIDMVVMPSLTPKVSSNKLWDDHDYEDRKGVSLCCEECCLCTGIGWYRKSSWNSCTLYNTIDLPKIFCEPDFSITTLLKLEYLLDYT